MSATETVSYFSGANNPQAGQALTIVLGATGTAGPLPDQSHHTVRTAGTAALAFTLGGAAGTQTLYLPIGD